MKKLIFVFGFLLLISACESHYDNSFEALINSKNYTQFVSIDYGGLKQTLHVDQNNVRYESEGQIYYVQSRWRRVDVYDKETDTTQRLSHSPIEEYIDLGTLDLDMFAPHNSIYRMQEETFESHPSIIEGLGDIQDVFMDYDDEVVTFTIFTHLPFSIHETMVEIIYSDIGTTRASLP